MILSAKIFYKQWYLSYIMKIRLFYRAVPENFPGMRDEAFTLFECWRQDGLPLP
jgi:hypothetical protein